ncbi:MAG TPA: hypothetical protein ENI23_17815 [bacterium]|nr:hypothetical protein [bacterium]
MARYDIKGTEYPSVTEVTGQVKDPNPLMYWAVKCMGKYILDKFIECNVKMGQTIIDEWFFDILGNAKLHYKEVSEKAKDIGLEVHNMISEYIKHKMTGKEYDYKGKYRPEVENGYLAFLEWESKNVLRYIDSELTVCESVHYGYAGRLDCIAELNDKRGIYVIDFKSSKGFYDDMPLQIAGYRYAYHDSALVEGCGILRLDKITGEPEWKDVSKKYERSLKAFQYLTKYWYYAKKRRLRNNPFVK